MWIDIDAANYFVTSSSGNGIKVIVHDHRVYPRSNQQGSAVAAGSEAYISIQKRKVKNLKPPYSELDCIEDSKGHKFENFPEPVKYTYEACMIDCHVTNIYKKCRCRHYYDQPLCTLADYYFCYRQNRNYFHKCDCLYPCNQIMYDTKLTTLTIPTPMVLAENRLRNDTYVTTEEIMQNMINLKVYFPSLQVTKVKQVAAYTFVELISNLGGQLGLFLGASLLTITEFFDYICRLCYYKLKTIKGKTKISSEVKSSKE